MKSKKNKRRRSEGPSPRALQLKVTLAGSEPPIWRRLLVNEGVPFGYLHLVLQLAMGWTNSHLHHFEVDGRILSPQPDTVDEFLAREENEDYSGLRLADLKLQKGQRFSYLYDFGDDWLHQIEVEEASPVALYVPVCIQGARACPLEDSGGVPGYEGVLEARADPKHPEHNEIREWVGDHFDPEAFDLAAVNARLQECFR